MMKKTQLIIRIFLVGLLIVVFSCKSEPNTKEAYLQKFEEFVNLIEQDYKSYTEQVWAEKDRIYKDYARKWYVKYKDQMDLKEEIRTKKNILKYQLFRRSNDLEVGFKEGIEAAKELGGDVLEIIEASGDSIFQKLNVETN